MNRDAPSLARFPATRRNPAHPADEQDTFRNSLTHYDEL
jgi:hypothetical protein